MLAAYATGFDSDDPLSVLEVGQRPDPQPADGWVTVEVKAASLNHHDLWSLRGIGLAESALPMILGCDAAGIDPDGREVIVHSVIGSAAAGGGDETFDPDRSLLSEKHQGTLAQKVSVPRENVLPKPTALSFEEAACLPTAWLTAYRMLFTRGQLQPGETVLVQGAGGGVASAAIMLARHAGARVWATTRGKADFALEMGAHAVFDSGQRLPHRVDMVIETVGKATWSHSIRSLRPGGRLVVSGATTGGQPPADLAHVYFRQLSIIGATMGTAAELRRLIDMCEATGLRPPIDEVFALSDARRAFERLAAGDVRGKLVLNP
ncbi:MAG: zinc-binding dehydrogenase [Candidatus Nanopelagicales bacterium]|mgnify:FL=1|nr:zinc-binding dehydrogenase [Actinomycetota bacterium]